MKRPSETTTAAIATVVAAVVGILAGYGVDIPAGVQAGAIVVIGYLGAAITWYVARRQRAGAAVSKPDGTVA